MISVLQRSSAVVNRSQSLTYNLLSHPNPYFLWGFPTRRRLRGRWGGGKQFPMKTRLAKKTTAAGCTTKPVTHHRPCSPCWCSPRSQLQLLGGDLGQLSRGWGWGGGTQTSCFLAKEVVQEEEEVEEWTGGSEAHKVELAAREVRNLMVNVYFVWSLMNALYEGLGREMQKPKPMG